MRVLFAEDDDVLADVVIEALADEGHITTHVRDQAAAHGIVERDRWDVLILDASGQTYSEPDPDERARLKHLADYAPVVLTTGRPWARELPPDAVSATAILPKPYDLDALIDVLHRIARGEIGPATA